MEIEDRWKRLKEEVKDLDSGAAEFHVKLLEDGKWLVTLQKTKRYPSILEIVNLVEEGKEWGFGGICWKEGEDRNLLYIKELRI